MRKNKQDNAPNTNCNSCFIHRVAHAQIGNINNESAIIISRNVSSAALRRVADLIEEASLCQECHVRDGTAIEMIRPDFGMMLTVDFINFLISAFEQENYDLEVDGENLEI